MFRTAKEARAHIGGVGNASKMPGWTFGLPALETCAVGSRLHASGPGKPCSDCYALKGRYVMPNVSDAQQRRLERLRGALASPEAADAWVAAWMKILKRQTHFRWHDAGDLVSVEHLHLLARVARACPHVKFWVPTQERATLRAYRQQYGSLPRNLRVRVSMPLLDRAPGSTHAGHFSYVTTDGQVPAGVHLCPAPDQGGKCRSCRACWSAKRTVAYRAH